MSVDFLTKSMLGMFARCPAQFERRYINNEIIPPGIAARQGLLSTKAQRLIISRKLRLWLTCH